MNELIEKVSIKRVIIFTIVFVLISIFFMQYMIKNRATSQDYKALYEQAKVIEKSFESLKTMDNVRGVFFDNYKALTLESKKCNLVLHFNDDFSQILEYEEQNRDIPIVIPLIMAIIMSYLLVELISAIFDV